MRITFDTEDGVTLEAELRLPDGDPIGSAVVCHAHPLFGGSKDYPLLWAIRAELATRGFAVVAFNFRGVMGSQGSHGGGVDEVLDVRAAVHRAMDESDGSAFVCGWSFGANVAIRESVEDERVGALSLIALPLARPDQSLPLVPAMPPPERLAAYERPVLLVAGSEDPYCPADALRGVGRHLARSTVEIVSGADHYFHRHERAAAELVGRFATAALDGGTAQ